MQCECPLVYIGSPQLMTATGTGVDIAKRNNHKLQSHFVLLSNGNSSCSQLPLLKQGHHVTAICNLLLASPWIWLIGN